MLAHVHHRLIYHYHEAVLLDPHVLYLHPRKSAMLSIKSFELTLDPAPSQRSKNLDPEGNIQTLVFFTQPCQQLLIEMKAMVETTEFNPFDFVFYPFESKQLPLIYQANYQQTLSPYLGRLGLHPDIEQVAAQLASKAKYQTAQFLMDLNAFIHTQFAYEIREEGHPNAPELTLKTRKGSCRDYAVLFAAICRSMGLATRFVSGYYLGPAPVDVPNQQHFLHAWVEVYLPGGGWRGYDPTQFEVVSGNHIPLAASCLPESISPVIGSYRGPSPSRLETYVNIERLD